MKLARPFKFLGELIVIEARLRGPRSESVRNLVLDTGATSWAEICKRHHDEWVLLAEVESEDARAITFARVVDHDESMIDIMDRNEPLPGTTLIQTASRPLWWLTRPHLILERDEEVPGAAPVGSGRTCPDEETRQLTETTARPRDS